MMRFIVDEQLPPSLADTLTEMGFEAVHVNDLGQHLKDDAIGALSLENQSIVLTRDDDFVRLALNDGVFKVLLISVTEQFDRHAWQAFIRRRLPEVLPHLGDYKVVEFGETAVFNHF